MLTITFNEINDLADYGIFCSAATQHLVVAAAAADVENAAMRRLARAAVSLAVCASERFSVDTVSL